MEWVALIEKSIDPVELIADPGDEVGEGGCSRLFRGKPLVGSRLLFELINNSTKLHSLRFKDL